MSKPRVLLVEDDASLRRFVRMALDDLPIELLDCADVACALQVLAQAPVDLILTDLMMPVESGLDMLERFKQTPRLRGQARVIVLSAGLSEGMRQALNAHDVWLLLDKPVAVSRLESSVREALADLFANDVVNAASVAPQAVGNSIDAGEALAADPLTIAPLENRAEALRLYFEGSPEIFEPYREACLAQFPKDLAQGEKASETGNLQDLRRVAHSLKSVLQTLGYPALSDVAKDCEAVSHAGNLAQARTLWATLAAQLQWIVNAGQG